MLPLAVSVTLIAPFAGWLLARLGMCTVVTRGMGLSAASLLGIAEFSLVGQLWLALGLHAAFVVNVSAALVASTAAIMSLSLPKKVGTAGSH